MVESEWIEQVADEEPDANGKIRVFDCTEDAAGQRVDRFLAAAGQWSRAYVQSLIERGCVTLQDKPVVSNSAKVRTGQTLQVAVPDAIALQVEPEAMPLDIVYEDRDVLVVNKKKGMVVHPAPCHPPGTLISGVLAYLGASAEALPGIALRPGIVHRIDKDTSGLLMIAKTELALRSLSQQLSEHSVTRVYDAIVHGRPGHDKGIIDASIGRSPNHRQQMAVVDDRHGKRAVTRFHVSERFTQYALLELRLETGRTHQIRVHMAYIGHPVAGDPLYAQRDPLGLEGQALHARTLGFTHPRTGERMQFEAPLPERLVQVLEQLRSGL